MAVKNPAAQAIYPASGVHMRQEAMTNQEAPPSPRLGNCWGRWALLGLGWLFVAAGLIGVVVPGMPTTVFLLAALWCFSRSSERFQMWLWNHRRLGPPIRAWHEHRVIPVRAKVLAAAMMAASFVYVALYVAEDWLLPALLAAVMLPAAAYVMTRSSRVPDAE